MITAIAITGSQLLKDVHIPKLGVIIYMISKAHKKNDFGQNNY